MTAPTAKRADQLVVGDQLPDECLPYRFNKGPAVAVLVAVENEASDSHTFVAYRYPNGRHDSMTVRSEAVLRVFPGVPLGHDYSRADDDPEPTQPSAGRLPAHLEDGRTGEVVMIGGDLAAGDAADEQRDNAYAAYDRDEAEDWPA